MHSGVKNIGAFRDVVKIYFESSQTTDDFGGSVIEYENYTLSADVNQVSSSQAMRLGLDLLSDNYTLTCRPPTNKRPLMVDYNGLSFRVISVQRDKLNKFLEITMTRNG